jgi:hypothetical protein
MSGANENSGVWDPAEGFAAMRAGESQLDFDIDFFDRVLERYPNYLDVLRCQGQLLSRKGLHARALVVDRRLVRLQPEDCVAHYNLACSLALSHQSADAIQELRSALEHGYEDFSYLESDRDLESLRDQPGYQDLLREFGIGD